MRNKVTVKCSKCERHFEVADVTALVPPHDCPGDSMPGIHQPHIAFEMYEVALGIKNQSS